MSADKRISAVIPAYNAIRTLERTLESVCSQLGANDEVILLDDCSSDGTLQLCERYSTAFGDMVRVIASRERHGPSALRNMGTEAARGSYICYIDSDDVLAPDALTVLYDFAETNGCGIVQAGFYYEYPDMLLRKKRNVKRYAAGVVLAKSEAMRSLVAGDFINDFAWGKLYKAEIAKKHRFREDISMGEDACLQHLMIEESEKIGVLSVPLYYYRQNPDSLSNNFSARHIGLLEACEERLRFLAQRYPELTDIHLRRYWHTAYNLMRNALAADERTAKPFLDYWAGFNVKYRSELRRAMRYVPEYRLYESAPKALDAYLGLKRIYSFAMRKAGLGEYERIQRVMK